MPDEGTRTVRDDADLAHEPVPDEWKQLGFSGLFTTTATIESGDVALWESRVPCRLPLGTNGNWLATRVIADPPSVVVVRMDWAAVNDFAFGNRCG